MNLGELIRVVARRWILIASFAVVGLLVVGLLQFKIGSGGIQPRKVSYTSEATLMLDQPAAQGAQAAAAMARLISLPQTLSTVVESTEIAKRAAAKLKGAYKADEIERCTMAEARLPTQLLTVSSCGDNATDAAAVTSAVVAAAKDWLKERQDQYNILGPNRLEFLVLSPPKVPDSPSGFPPFMWIVIGLFGGLLIGLITAFGVESVQSAPGAAPASLPARATGVRPVAAQTPHVQSQLPLPAVPGSRQRPRRRA